jgi:hypothetical protein
MQPEKVHDAVNVVFSNVFINRTSPTAMSALTEINP